MHYHHIAVVSKSGKESRQVLEQVAKWLDEDYEIINAVTPVNGGVIYILCKNEKK